MLIRRLNEGVHVIVLNRVVHEAKAPAFAGGREAALELADQADRP
jgi:hypothetical protein